MLKTINRYWNTVRAMCLLAAFITMFGAGAQFGWSVTIWMVAKFGQLLGFVLSVLAVDSLLRWYYSED